MIYLDNASTTMIDPVVLEAMMPYLKEQYGNPGTPYRLGRAALDAINKSREQVAEFLGADPEQIVFTSGGTESNNMVLRGIKRELGDVSVAVSNVEHDSILRTIRQSGLNNYPIKADSSCVVREESVIDTLNEHDDVGFVSVMYVNNETGAVNPIKQISDICKARGVLFHTDCVQAAGCQIINANDIGCDFLSISSHKIHGAKGVGALFVKRREVAWPLIYGGASQEFGLRGGTENVAGIVGFGKACEIAMKTRKDYETILSYYRKEFFWTLTEKLRKYNLDSIIKLNGASIGDGGKTLSITIEGVDAETLVLMMDAHDICISSGAACKSRESHPSHVLVAIGLTPDQARNTVRISFSRFNNDSDVKKAARTMADCVRLLVKQRHVVEG